MKHFKQLSIILLSLLMVLSMTIRVPQAATSKTIKNNVTYTVKLNGKKKTLRVETTTFGYQDYLENVTIKVAGQSAYSYDTDPYDYYLEPENKLFIMNNGKAYLWMKISMTVRENMNLILYYNGSKFVKAAEGTCLPGCTASQSGLMVLRIDYAKVTVSGNKLRVYYNVNSDALGYIEFYDTLKYSKGKLVRSSRTVSAFKAYKDVSGTWKKATVFKTTRKLKAYRSAGSTRVKFTIPAEKNITFKSLWINKGKMYLKVKYGSKIGWLNVTKFNAGDPAFYDMTYSM